MTFSSRRKVSYFYDSEVGNYYYAQGHPMKPHRMRMTHNLLLSYGLLEKMDFLTTPRASQRDMTRFHSDEYINFLNVISPECLRDHATALCRFNVLEDCPVFDGLWEYCQIAAGGSLAGVSRLNSGDADVAVNWAGGLHHAKKAEASGFCYINDCVLAILELLKVHARVLYVDIDIHHGDGVEEAFYTTDRVMTASFHKFGDYFPGTGDVTDVGVSRGKHYSANFPLRDGIDDESYREIFVPVMSRIMEWFQPGAVVLQCGADSLSGDRLGCFNLSLLGHAQCVDFFKRYDTPLLLLGGGGYTIRNVARCWAYETSRVLGETLSDELPYNENYEFYGPEFRLHIVPSNMENHNSPSELHKTKMRIFENLRHLPHAPSVPMMDTPRHSPITIFRREEDTGTATVAADDDEDDPDVRKRSRRAKFIVDYAGSDDDFDDQLVSSLRTAKRKYKRLNFSRRRFPSAVLSGDKSRDMENDGHDDGHPMDVLDRRALRARGSSISSTAPARENDVQEWVEKHMYKSRRRDRPIRYYEVDADGMMEDSRRTVSGMSNVKDVEMADADGNSRHWPRAVGKREQLAQRRHDSRVDEGADEKSELRRNSHIANRRDTTQGRRRPDFKFHDDDDEEHSALAYLVSKRGSRKVVDLRELDSVPGSRRQDSITNGMEKEPANDNGIQTAERKRTDKDSKKGRSAAEGMETLDDRPGALKENGRADGMGSADDERDPEARSILRAARIGERMRSEMRDNNDPSYNDSGRNDGANENIKWMQMMRTSRADAQRGEVSSDDEVSWEAAQQEEESGDIESKTNGKRSDLHEDGEMDGEGETQSKGMAERKEIANGQVDNESASDRRNHDATVVYLGERGEEADVEAEYDDQLRGDGGDDDEDSDNGHGGENVDSGEGVSGGAEDTSGEAEGSAHRRGGVGKRNLEMNGGMDRSVDAVGDVDMVDGSGNGEDDEGNSDGDDHAADNENDDVMERDSSREADGSTGVARRRAGEGEERNDDRSRRIRGKRSVERWKNWRGKRRAVLDEGSASEYEDWSWRRNDKHGRNGESNADGDKEESDRDEDERGDVDETNDRSNGRGSNNRYAPDSNDRSCDEPR